MTVSRYLITGTDYTLMAFAFKVNWFANATQQKQQTILYTVSDEGVDAFMSAALECGLTVQRIDYEDGQEKYVMVHQGAEPSWHPSRESG